MFHIDKKIILNFNRDKGIFFNFWKTKSTFYDVLHLKKDCSSKEIKDAYIRLSKLYHPDTSESSKNSHQKFLKINEAYNTLSKPLSRKNYDLELQYPKPPVVYEQRYQNYDAASVYKETIFHRGKAGPPRDDEYYGVKGIKKQPHLVIVLICAGIAIIGLAIQMIVVKISYIVKKEKLQKESEANRLMMEEIRKTSDLDDRQLQILILKERFEQDERERKKRFG